MTALDSYWLGSTAFLTVIAFLRFRAGLQKIGSLTVAVFMALSAIAILCGAEKLAYAFQIVGVVFSAGMIALNERWKRTQK